MNSSLPNDKDKAPQGAQTVAAATPSSSDSDSSKGVAGPTSQYVVGPPPQQDVVPTWSTGLFECFDDIPTCKSNNDAFFSIVFYFLYQINC